MFLLTIASILAACGQLLFRSGARGQTSILELVNAQIVTGLILNAAGTVIWIYALSKEKLVDVYVFTALTFALVYLGATRLLGERLDGSGILGVGLVLVGIFLITRVGS